jgi:alpha-tubulin suppressor-like RCC1 family protein
MKKSLITICSIFAALMIASIVFKTFKFINGDHPLPPQPMPRVTAIAVEDYFTLYLTSDGSLWGVGANGQGQLGDGQGLDSGNRPSSFTPKRIIAGGVIAISVKYAHSMFLKSDGSVWTIGENAGDLLVGGTTTAKAERWYTPVRIVDGGVTSISAGYNHFLFIKDDGSLWAAGQNESGQLGDGTKNNRPTPVRIIESGVIAIAAGNAQSLIIKSDGSLWGMGWNPAGEAGGSTPMTQEKPMCIVASGVTAIATGVFYDLFIKSDGSLWGMGHNEKGQLGDGTTTERRVPVQIVSSGVVAISAGEDHSLFLKNDGSLWGMGVNLNGQVGSTKTNQLTPVRDSNRAMKLPLQLTPVRIVPSGVIAISVGGSGNSMFIKNDGSLWAMGDNHGAFGDGGQSPRLTPEQVTATVSPPGQSE